MASHRSFSSVTPICKGRKPINALLCCDRRRALLKLPNHHRIIYQLIERNPGITSANLMKAYRERCRELNTPPVARRTFTHYLSRMRDVGLVQEDQARERGRVRCFKVR